MKTSSQLKTVALGSLKGKHGQSILVAIIVYLLSAVPFMGGPIQVGYCKYNLKLIRGEETSIEDTFDGFNIFGRALWLQIMVAIFLSLWAILLYIPALVKVYSYSMANFYLADNPELTASQALLKSRQLMDGKKGSLFYICLSFLGWGLLSCVTFGIGLIWFIPYASATMAAFYDNAVSVSKTASVTGEISD